MKEVVAREAKIKKNFIEGILPGVSSISLLFLLGIGITLIFMGLPIFKEYGFMKFIFGTEWRPTDTTPALGILSLIVASWIITLGAVVIAVPLGVGSAIYISEMASENVRAIVKPVMEVLAGVPSVVFGFFGIVFVAPLVQTIFHLPTGLGGFTSALILGVMAVPTIASITEDALSAVPKDIRNASYALGANKWETIIKTVLPTAKSGIFTAIVLGTSRAMGETMTVLMVGGGATKMPTTLFEPMRAMTATIALEMGETVVGSIHYQALFGIGLVLFLSNIMLSLIAELYLRAK